MRKVYKVIRVMGDGRRVSAVMGGEAQATYVPGKWTHGCEGTPLVAFRAQRTARAYGPLLRKSLGLWGSFADHKLEVWEAETTNMRSAMRTEPRRLSSLTATCKTVMRFWDKKTRSQASTQSGWPSGSFLCDAIRLRKQIV